MQRSPVPPPFHALAALALVVLLVACADATAVPRPTPWLWGDVNCDGAVTTADHDLVMRHAVGLSIVPFDTLPGDVDADGHVNTRDALIIQSFVQGLPTAPFRVGQPMPASPCAGFVPPLH